MTDTRPRVLIIAGYFDWFSGYQETALASAFSRIANTEIIASDRVSPAFSDEHLAKLGITRRYHAGTSREHGVKVTRFASWEKRSMVWAAPVRAYINSQQYDLVVQVMPGQGLPVAASLSKNRAPRVVLYGDNRGMWEHLTKTQRLLKAAAFTVSKGVAYAFVNWQAERTYGYTQNTIDRLRPFTGRRPMSLMPLSYTPDRFNFDEQLRSDTRSRLNIRDNELLILSAGKFEARKKLEWLISAFESLSNTNKQLRLLLVGSDSSQYSETLIACVDASRAAPRISIQGFVASQELNALFNAADVAIWPRYPAITIQQAMGTGLAVALPRTDYVGHLIRPGAGTYYDLEPGGEAAQIESALLRTIQEFRFGTQARRERVALNSWLNADVVARKLLCGESLIPH